MIHLDEIPNKYLELMKSLIEVAPYCYTVPERDQEHVKALKEFYVWSKFYFTWCNKSNYVSLVNDYEIKIVDPICDILERANILSPTFS